MDTGELSDRQKEDLIEEAQRLQNGIEEEALKRKFYQCIAIHTDRMKELKIACDCKYCYLEYIS